jgi:hypothetical protein
MLIEQVRKLSPIAKLIYWIRERHSIHIKKEQGEPAPWTDDEVLCSFFFTNPYRENDKVTQWFRKHIRDPLKKDAKVVFATICFRWFNWPETGEVLINNGLLEEWDCKKAVKVLTNMKDKGKQVFTGAFNISNSGSKKPKINRVCEDYIEPVWENIDWIEEELKRGAYEHKTTMQNVHEFLSENFMGLGGSGFMAYEVVCDLRYTWVLENAPDKCTWSNAGPGAKRGLNRILGRELKAPVSDELWQDKSTSLLKIVQERLSRMPRFEMREIEHSLCEVDKYCRALEKDGHMKRKYNGG